jgi:mycofactocin radical SAM maturase
VSTDGSATALAGATGTGTAGAVPFDVDKPWRLDERVAVRPEPFGALMYHFGTRKLSFLKSTSMLAVVRSLAGQPSARAACAAAGVGDSGLPAYERALAMLAASQMIVARGEDAPGPPADRPPGGRAAGDRPREPAAPPRGAQAAPPRGADKAPQGRAPDRMPRLADQFASGLAAPICLTWELTYACNLACVHCLSSSGRRDPRELTTAECKEVIAALQRMGVFYVNIGGGEPTIRPDFWELVGYATARQVGVKFSTNGVRIDAAAARRLAASDYVDVQISLDGATAGVNDAVRGAGSHATAIRAMENLRAARFKGFKISVVVTRHNIAQLDELKALADAYGAQLRLTRLRPSGRGADTWHELHPTADQQRQLYDWLLAHGEQVLTGDSFFHLSPYGRPLPGLNMCGAGRVVCLIDPVGDVYACPFAIHEEFRAGNVRQPGGFEAVWRDAALFADLRRARSGGACTSCEFHDSCRGGCMAAKFFTGLPLDGPDPECVRGHGAEALKAAGAATVPRPRPDHSHRGPVRGQAPVPVTIGRRPAGPAQHAARLCEDHPLAGLTPGDAR